MQAKTEADIYNITKTAETSAQNTFNTELEAILDEIKTKLAPATAAEFNTILYLLVSSAYPELQAQQGWLQALPLQPQGHEYFLGSIIGAVKIIINMKLECL